MVCWVGTCILFFLLLHYCFEWLDPVWDACYHCGSNVLWTIRTHDEKCTVWQSRFDRCAHVHILHHSQAWALAVATMPLAPLRSRLVLLHRRTCTTQVPGAAAATRGEMGGGGGGPEGRWATQIL